jgi:hypothetical protein
MDIVLYGMGICSLVVIIIWLLACYKSHWKPWVGVGLVLNFDEKTRLVTVQTFLIDSSAGRAKIKRGSVVLKLNGEELPSLVTKRDFSKWRNSFKKPLVGDVVTYTILERSIDGDQEEREVTLENERLYGDIPIFHKPFFTKDEVQDFREKYLGKLAFGYSLHRCPKTGVWYQTRWIRPY